MKWIKNHWDVLIELGKLRSIGYILRSGNKLEADISRIPKGFTVNNNSFDIENIKRKLGKCELEILNVLLDHFEDEYTKEELGEATPSKYSGTSGGFANALGRLNTLGLITRSNGKISLSEDTKELI